MQPRVLWWLALHAFVHEGWCATTYHHVAQGNSCESQGYVDTLTNADCETAATAVSFADTDVCSSCPVTTNTAFPNG